MTWARGGGDYKDAPVGTHIARCVGLIDLGTQKHEYQGKTSIRRQNIIRWELPTELMDEGGSAGKPFTVSKFYTTSLHEKANLYADLVNWRGREFTPEELAGFEEKNLLDKVCMVSLTENDKGKVRVTALIAKPKTMECPPRVNDLVYFSLEPDRFDRATFDRLSDGIKTIIMKSPEWAELNGGGVKQQRAPGADFDDDIPFIVNECVYAVDNAMDRRLRRARLR
jgi:hypothetical protein